MRFPFIDWLKNCFPWYLSSMLVGSKSMMKECCALYPQNLHSKKLTLHIRYGFSSFAQVNFGLAVISFLFFKICFIAISQIEKVAAEYKFEKVYHKANKRSEGM